MHLCGYSASGSSSSFMSMVSCDNFNDLLPMDIAGKYEIVPDSADREPGLLGRGSFGHVYRCRPMGAEAPLMAAKRIDTLDMTEAQIQGILSEGTFLSKLDHKNVIRVHETIRTDDAVYIVMELCDGRNLLEYVQAHGALEEADAVCVAQQVMRALEHIHGRGIAHRDVKPTNIMVTDDLQVKLVDFGLACSTRGPVRAVGVQGTEAFMPLECVHAALGSGSVSSAELRAADMYSAGAALYQAVVGVYVYTPRGEVRVLRMRSLKKQMLENCDKRLNCLKNLPLAECIRSLLSHDAARRPSAQQAVHMV